MQFAATFVIQTVVNILQFFDWLANYPQKLFYSITKGFAVAAILFFTLVPAFHAVMRTNIPLRSQLTDGLSYNINGDSPQPPFNSLGVAVLGASDVAQNVPALVSNIKFPDITSKSVLVMDLTTSKPLYQLN